MTDFYVDSSVLVKRHVTEIGSNWFKNLASSASGNIILTSRISVLEVYSAFNRRIREASISVTDYAQVAADFEFMHQNEYRIIELNASIATRARTLLEGYALRAYDAAQLASALIISDLFRSVGFAPVIFLASDHRLLSAAKSEGLATDDPNNHP